MTTLPILIGTAVLFFVVEKLWPANELPRVRGWCARVALVNLSQIGILVVDFADLTFGMLMIHLFTFDPDWKPRRGCSLQITQNPL